MKRVVVTAVGKAARALARLRGGSGSALPGLVVEKLDPSYIATTLGRFPRGVVLVSGTNGKTTTTKMVVELLQGQGLRVFTNKTGSNFTRGVAAALLGEADWRGEVDADIAVLELDEAYAVHFVKLIKPRHSLLLNVMRDQLDRFGEIDATARLLTTVAENTTEGVVLNRDDPRIRAISEKLDGQKVDYFGFDPSLRSLFPDDDSLHAGDSGADVALPDADVAVLRIGDGEASFDIGGAEVTTPLKLNGIYNIVNAAAALALVRQVLGDALDESALITSLANVEPAFGRGESVLVDGQKVELVLVKNPSGFRLGLSSFDPAGHVTMIAINDNYADGRDMSWLWDVEFDSLRSEGVAYVTGSRAYDMALRLWYDQVPVGTVETDLTKALHAFLAVSPGTPKRIFTTYTAMLALRRELGTMTSMKAIDQ